jgi:hypothetical protein
MVRTDFNDIRIGIAAANARIHTGRFMVCTHRCPNLKQAFAGGTASKGCGAFTKKNDLAA